MSNLPTFQGAAKVYERAERIAAHLNSESYLAQRAAHTRSPKSFRFTPNEDAAHIISAMNRGDEETLKACIAKHLAIALAD